MNLAVRSTLPFETLAPQLRAAVAEVDTSLPIVRMRTMEEVFGDAVQRPRFLALLLMVFAASPCCSPRWERTESCRIS